VSAVYVRELDGALGAWMNVDFTTDRQDVTNYSIVLLVEEDEQIETVRVYDGAHGENEMHRYSRQGGKQAAEVFHRGTLGEGMRSAIETIERGYAVMIEGWRTQ
jgi:hypothetical protein